MIELKNISFAYESGTTKNCIKDVNLLIKRGEVVLLTGGSGCGKTTITRLINGLIPNYYEGKLAGEVLVDGYNVSEVPIYHTAKQVGSVFQNPRSQFFNVDTTSELAFAPENQGIPEEDIRKRIETTVEDFKIESLMNRSIFKLSGGEKQKIACASVSVADSNIIVLDEPSSNLDSATIEELKNMIDFWKSKGKTIIIAEHRLYYLRDIADRMIILEDGCIKKEFRSSEIKLLSREDTKMLGLRPLQIESLDFDQDLCKQNESKVSITNFLFTFKDSNHGIKLDKTEFPEKSIVAVIGHNGAGKSTFAKCLCGLEKSCKGVVNISGKNYGNKERLKNCYMVMQDVNHQLFTESVLDEVLLSLGEKSSYSEEEKVKESEKILESLDLIKFKDLHPMSLSGGQKQRVAIASAVASKRKLILFDEPTSGLDLLHMNQVAEHLRKLSQMGKTVFVITHDPELILNSCTEVLHLENGSVKETYSLDKNNAEKLKKFFLGSIERVE